MAAVPAQTADHDEEAPRRGASSYLPVVALALVALIWGYN
jgi:hypothetical protein